MIICSNLRVSKAVEADGRINAIWNNLIRAISIVSGTGFPGTFTVYNPYGVIYHRTPEFELNFGNNYGYADIMFRCDYSFANDLGGALEIVAMTTSAMEYVVDREDCLAIEEWRFMIGNLEDRYQDVGVDSIADMLRINKEHVIDLLEKHVEPKLDEIEGACL